MRASADTLQIRLLGQTQVARGGRDLSRFPTQKSLALFSFLALNHRKLHPRETLAGLFWPSGSKAAARKRLRTELWLTRKFLEPEASTDSMFSVCNGSIGLNPQADLWLDVADLETRLEPFETRGSTPTQEDGEHLEQAAELYRGDLLEGRYDDWCIEARERLRIRFLKALGRWMDIRKDQGSWTAAIDCGELILQHEPLTESVHRALMACHFALGNRVAALSQFNRCRAVLKAELDVEPMYETTLLYQRIKNHRDPRLFDMELDPNPNRVTAGAH